MELDSLGNQRVHIKDCADETSVQGWDLVLPSSYKYIECFLTLRCNLACSFCINTIHEEDDKRRRNSLGEKTNNSFKDHCFDEMGTQEWISGINRIKTRPGIPITLGGGEPFMHKGFIDIINGISPDKEIDILTNLRWGKNGLERFAEGVNPDRLKRKGNSPYASIRVSYHPGESGMDPVQLAKDVRFMQNKGFKLQVESVLYPSPKQITAIHHFNIIAREHGIDFRVKEFVGEYQGKDDFGRSFLITYGDYSRYPGAAFSKTGLRYADCKTTELLVGPNGNIYRCHTDLYDGKREIGRLLDPNFKIKDIFRPCYIFGRCNPCDVKVKTDHNQIDGNTSVEIINIGKHSQ
jgi:hypothetical protein